MAFCYHGASPMTTPLLTAAGLSFSYGGPNVLEDIGIAVEAGEMVGLVGPNGSGKSTLLRLLAGLERPTGGEVRLEDRDVAGLSRPELARNVAYVPQDFDLAFTFTVREVVLTGRHPHMGWLALESREDVRVAEAAMEAVGIADLAQRGFHTLSGGERQRVVIAAALAQEPRLLVLDEPTSSLDLHFQDGLMRALRRRLRDTGTAVVLAVHDLNLALAWCPRVWVLRDGRVAADGAPRDVLSEARLAEVYGPGARVIQHQGATVVLPAGPEAP